MSGGMGMINKSPSERRQEEEQERQIRKERSAKEVREKQAEERDHQGFVLTKRNYWWAVAGIIASILLGIAQIGFSYYDIHYGKDFKHETRIIELDSIQVEQNKEIIKLLEHKK